jgi:hypothetical protein
VKKLFGDHLVQIGMAGAGAVYRSLADTYESCFGMTTSQARAMLTGVIRQKEAEGRAKL